MWLTHSNLIKFQTAWNKTFPDNEIWISHNKERSTIVSVKYDINHLDKDHTNRPIKFTGKISDCMAYIKGMASQKPYDDRAKFHRTVSDL